MITLNAKYLKRALFPLLALLILWQLWPKLLLWAMQGQQRLYSDFNQLLLAVSEHQQHALIALLGLSFLYGILHAVGPGHGKVVMSSYLASHQERFKTGILLTLVAALGQAVVAIVLVGALRFILLMSAHQVNHQALTLIHFNSLLIIALGFWFLFKAWRKLHRRRVHYQSFALIDKPQQLIRPTVNHESCSCCGHHHIDATQLKSLKHWQDYLLLIVSISARPCSGALFLLSICALLGIFGTGVLATIAMALGTGITTSAIALLTVGARQWLLRLYPSRQPNRWLQALPLIIAAMLLIIMGVALYQLPIWQGIPRFLQH